MNKIASNIRLRFIAITYLISLFIVVLIAFLSYNIGKEILFLKLQDKLNVIVSLGSLSIDMELVDKYKKLLENDLSHDEILKIEEQNEYKTLFSQINSIKNIQPDTIRCAYILSPTQYLTQAKFIIDCDIYQDRSLEVKTQIAHLGYEYDITTQKSTLDALRTKQKVIDSNFTYDEEWGVYSLMGFHPLYTNKGEFLGVLGIDIYDEKYFLETQQLLRFIIIISSFFSIILLFVSYYISSLFFHISNLNSIQEDLEKSYKQLKKLDDKKTEFLNITSHELRTPITSMNGYLSMILDGDMGVVSDEVKNYLQKIFSASKRLGNLVNDMLDIAKLESGKIEYFHEKFLINKIINDVVFDFEVLAKEKGQKIIVNIDNTKELFLKSDVNKVRQCIINLVSNAYKYNKENGFITISSSHKNNVLLIEIEDTGIGISQENLDVIFEKFGQIKNSLTRDIDGTGLGLSIVKGFVEKLGGKITVESTLGVGSVFRLYLPIE